MEKLNITEFLKDCPKGTKLYSPIFGDVYLDKIKPHLAIVVTTDKEQGDFKEEFLYDGRYGMNGECMLFPSKGKTTWKGFERPFKDGDIISNGAYIAIFHKFGKPDFCAYNKVIYYHCLYNEKYEESKFKKDFGIGRDTDFRFATDEEKQKLFDTIKANGYKWDSETKTLEKLVEPKFKVGDIVQDKDGYKVRITEVNIEDECYGYESLIANGIGGISFNRQDDWKLYSYPETYEECRKIIDYHLTGTTIIGYKKSLLENFQQLLICRDAYWKIAGEQMGLCGSWKPENLSKYYNFTIETKENQIICNAIVTTYKNRILSFPTTEMRDAFYKNFKDLIEQCKELL